MKEERPQARGARATEARKALSTLGSDLVVPLLDVDKLVKSAIFAEMIDMAAEHALTCRDSGYVNRLVRLVASSKHEKALIDWFCLRVGLKASTRDGRPYLSKSDVAGNGSARLAKYFPSAVVAQERALLGRQRALQAAQVEVRVSNPRLRVVEVRSDDYVDMLDSRARLPGSFGSGKRR